MVSVSSTELVGLWRMMFLIRHFELAVSEAYAAGKIPGFVHLSIGQEAVAAGVGAALRPDDFIYVSHRGHGQCLAKGAEAKLMMAELYGKATGYCQGRGGSMHVAARERGVLGANGIVGGSFPLAVGAAYAIQTLGKDQVVVVMFGEGAVNEGTFHEALNLATLWTLPVVFVCENNSYAQFTPMASEHANLEVHTRAAAYGVEGIRIDGNDAALVFQTARSAVDKARRGGGPTLVECLTYRWHGHYEGDPEKYRERSEVERWKLKDPLVALENLLRSRHALTELEAEAWHAAVSRQIAEATEFAELSPAPEPESALRDVYV